MSVYKKYKVFLFLCSSTLKFNFRCACVCASALWLFCEGYMEDMMSCYEAEIISHYITIGMPGVW